MKLSTVFSILILFTQMAWAEERMAVKDFLKKELASFAKLSKESFSLTPEQKKQLVAIAPEATDSEFTFYYGKSSQDKIEKACLIVPQEGKEGPMTIGTCYDPSGQVQSVTVLSSEEERGKKATEESWLKQFKGKKISDAYQVGKDVDGVSGATWTSKAVAEALRKSGFAFQSFVKEKK